MKTNSIAAAYPLTAHINVFSSISWSPTGFTEHPYAEHVERKVLYYHRKSQDFSVKLRKGSREWDSHAVSKAKHLPLGLI